MLKVIDVSRWQQTINWGAVKSNVDAAMIKIGGSDDGFYMDGMAQRNLIEARNAGVPIGMYVFLGGVYGIQEEVQHIKNLIIQLGGLKPGEPFCLDWERTRSNGDEVGYLTGIVEGLATSGFPAPLIYMSLSRVRAADWQNLKTRNCGLWVAAWGNNDDVPEPNEVPTAIQPWDFWAMWQFSSNTNVPGIVGRVDQNQFNGDVAAFRKYGLGGQLNIPGTATPVGASTPPNSDEYVVAAGDNLSAIAAKYGTNWQTIFSMNRDRISNPDRIYTNQKLRVPQGGAPASPQQPTATHRTHIVVNGENLSVIASNYGLSSWHPLYEANRGTIGNDPNMIRPGMELAIP